MLKKKIVETIYVNLFLAHLSEAQGEVLVCYFVRRPSVCPSTIVQTTSPLILLGQF